MLLKSLPLELPDVLVKADLEMAGLAHAGLSLNLNMTKRWGETRKTKATKK